jgi:GNAT superfamily N-acetyltransferase
MREDGDSTGRQLQGPIADKIKTLPFIILMHEPTTIEIPNSHDLKGFISSTSKEAMATFTITKVRTSEDLAVIRNLFIAYTKWLNIDLTYQNFQAELAVLPGKYFPPGGELLLARSMSTNEPLGCVALRPLFPPECAEMKRLYVTPVGRGTGVGKALIKQIMEVAKGLGDTEIKLDTLSHMEAALGIYKSNGFVECEKYYETPMAETVFLRKEL